MLRRIVDNVSDPQLSNYKVAAGASAFLGLSAFLSNYACHSSLSLLLGIGSLGSMGLALNQFLGDQHAIRNTQRQVLTFFDKQPTAAANLPEPPPAPPSSPHLS